MVIDRNDGSVGLHARRMFYPQEQVQALPKSLRWQLTTVGGTSPDATEIILDFSVAQESHHPINPHYSTQHATIIAQQNLSGY